MTALPRRSRRLPWIVLFAAWVVAVGAGMHLVWKYKAAAGETHESPSVWPDGTTIARTPGVPALIMFAHAHCVCTRASLGELAWLMARFAKRVDAHVLVLRPAGTPPGWEHGDNQALAAGIPGVRVEVDGGGREAARFGAATSGHAVLYDGDGDLVFSGGITGARGHPGDNLGRAAVASFIETGRANRPGSPVFGCALDDPEP